MFFKTDNGKVTPEDYSMIFDMADEGWFAVCIEGQSIRYFEKDKLGVKFLRSGEVYLDKPFLSGQRKEMWVLAGGQDFDINWMALNMFPESYTAGYKGYARIRVFQACKHVAERRGETMRFKDLNTAFLEV